jgi:menaquinol-cytochrome c reductase iron-sulfur subunit
MSDDSGAPDRRRFLQLATCAIGGGIGVVAIAPVLRLVVDPATKTTVSTPTDPLDLGDAAVVPVGADPRRFDVVAPVVKDAWTAARDVVLGAAWIRRTAPDKYEAFSAVCPHLGCAIGWDATGKTFLCPCHDSRFEIGGDRLTGPAERGLDPLPLTIVDGRLKLVWARYRMGGETREPA